MGVRGLDDLVADLSASPAAASVQAVAQGIADLAALRHSALDAAEIRALGELWQRLSAQVNAGRLQLLAEMYARDDVIPKARVGDAGAVFGQHVLGQRRSTARRHAQDALLLRPDAGDLPCVGAVHAAGDVSEQHVEVAVRAHRRLGAAVRDELVDCSPLAAAEVADGAEAQTLRELDAVLGELSDGFTRPVRQVLVVDATLAFYARRLTVAELSAVADRIVATLAPPSSEGSHERRYLHLSQVPGGGWVGRFECSAAQGLLIERALAAVSAPRPGVAIDADGVRRELPDTRDLGARQMDGLSELVAVALDRSGLTVVDGAIVDRATGGTAGHEGSRHDGGMPDGEGEDDRAPDDGPAREGREVVLRPPGVRSGRFPHVELVLIAGLEHVAAALGAERRGLPLDLDHAVGDALHRRFGDRLGGAVPTGRTGEGFRGQASRGDPRERGEPPPGVPLDDLAHGGPAAEPAARRDPAWLRRALSPSGTPARLEHAGLVDAATLELLACNATVRAAVLAPGGALLDLGRAQRLASPAQNTALNARDGGCVVPGCTVPGDGCEAHHVIWWSRGGPTDLDNLALVCGRHHEEVHSGDWEIEMRGGVPWVRVPRWVDRYRPLLRNAAHHPLGHSERRDESGGREA